MVMSNLFQKGEPMVRTTPHPPETSIVARGGVLGFSGGFRAVYCSVPVSGWWLRAYAIRTNWVLFAQMLKFCRVLSVLIAAIWNFPFLFIARGCFST
jgi:hypothetical protein